MMTRTEVAFSPPGAFKSLGSHVARPRAWFFLRPGCDSPVLPQLALDLSSRPGPVAGLHRRVTELPELQASCTRGRLPLLFLGLLGFPRLVRPT